MKCKMLKATVFIEEGGEAVCYVGEDGRVIPVNDFRPGQPRDYEMTECPALAESCGQA